MDILCRVKTGGGEDKKEEVWQGGGGCMKAHSGVNLLEELEKSAGRPQHALPLPLFLHPLLIKWLVLH